ncbi:type II secretion system protein [Gordonibacter massiliensis (ex Traore et al. 2017)]|uniref:type II secretion system protein n=1 Tax=Gordonibacter massiliensis (ex Traore et al. 2017) TaxID=1841863 RepID=UPI001FEC8115|nr:type II secretion system protein [Gordonibacter massiliensis (ex Traore et al. 2017)]
MIKRVREEKGGFTLAELLIVVAIILVLVAVAVPVFTGALDNANTATAQSNLGAVRSSAGYKAVSDNETTFPLYYEAKIDRHGKLTDLKKSASTTETTEANIKDWLSGDDPTYTVVVKIEDVEAVTS